MQRWKPRGLTVKLQRQRTTPWIRISGSAWPWFRPCGAGRTP